MAVYPLWEGRRTSSHTFVAIFKDITGRGKPITHGRATLAETVVVEEKLDTKKAGESTPPEKEVLAEE